PVHALSKTEAAGIVETMDGKLRITVRAVLGPSNEAAVVFDIQNRTDQTIRDLRFAAYTNMESAHTHDNDFSMLDRQMGGLLVIDPPTGVCLAMAGLEPMATGFCGVWASEGALREGKGIPLAQWRTFEPDTWEERLRTMAITWVPHAPAPPSQPTEPPVQTMSPMEADAALVRDWLFQADGNPTFDRAAEELEWTRSLIRRLVADPCTRSLQKEIEELDHLAERLAKKQGEPKELYLAIRRVKRRIAFANPALTFDQILFIDQPYPQGAEWPHQARHRNGMMAVPGGRLLVLDGLHPGGKIRKLGPMKPGSYWRPDVSWDGQRILFCFKPCDESSFHLYEINTDGSGLQQLTDGPYDDLDPIYEPDGHIIFTTTRCNTYVRCMPYTYSYILARCNADGSDIYLLSRNNEPDWCPSLLHDGRIIYSRWEYHDKALWRIQSLWVTNQDGTQTEVFWGNQSVWPDHLAEPRAIPGSRRVLFTGLAHHDWFAGSIGIIDPDKGQNFPHGLTKVTAEIAWPECGQPPIDPIESPRYHTAGQFSAYKTPYPIGEEDFLVSARIGGRDGKFNLYFMDIHGNRELIYEGAHNIWHAMPLEPRRRPPVHPDRVAWPKTLEERAHPQPGLLYSPDVFEGISDLPRGSVQFLRVIQMDSRTYSTWTRDGRFSGPVVSAVQDDGVKRILGTVPVDSDGSVYVEVPPGQALHFQLLNEQYQALHTMRSFTGVMPGEQRSCLGCHEMHSSAPVNAPSLALRHGPRKLTPPPWGSVSMSYEKLVQPVFERHCGSCHIDSHEGRKALDLTLRPGIGPFKEPYLTLVGYANYFHAASDVQETGIAGALMAENFNQSDPASYRTFQPMGHLSYTSRLIEMAMSGDHYATKITGDDLRLLIGWIDANCPYRGDDEIRALADPSFPGIDALPIRPRTKTAPIIHRP
ncbi:MAG: hypothetical protein JW829_15465, partial [Pirellulales bacterium]|nr:hypothetical protein [Pirellulales bacterium]